MGTPELGRENSKVLCFKRQRVFSGDKSSYPLLSLVLFVGDWRKKVLFSLEGSKQTLSVFCFRGYYYSAIGIGIIPRCQDSDCLHIIVRKKRPFSRHRNYKGEHILYSQDDKRYPTNRIAIPIPAPLEWERTRESIKRNTRTHRQVWEH